jgi:hypothetical protein
MDVGWMCPVSPDDFTEDERRLVAAAHPREISFRKAIIDACAKARGRSRSRRPATWQHEGDPAWMRPKSCSTIPASA